MSDNEYRHWAEVIAEQAIDQYGEKHIVCAGWSPSGVYHIGNSREAVTGYAIHRSLLQKGKSSEFVFVIDDFDPLDKIPQDLKKYSRELRPYLGHPLCDVPDFTEEYESYAEYFASGAKKAMSNFGFDTTFVYASEQYNSGKYDDFLRIYLEHDNEIDELFEEITGSALDTYVSVICQNCGNMKTPQITEIKGDEIYYKCISDRMFRGCDDEGSVSIDSHQWKLKWRLDWPARQTFLGVTVEPSGKDHSVSGGSVDTAIEIHKRILDQGHPVLERYGFITLKGMKFSGSKGGALAASEVAEIMPASAYLYLIYRSDLMKDIDFNPASIEYAKLLDEYDDARRMLMGEEFPGREREVEKLSTAADLALDKNERNFLPADVKFEELTLIYQTSLKDIDRTIEKLHEMGKIQSEAAENELRRRLELSEQWLNTIAPDSVKIEFLETPHDNIKDFWSEDIITAWLNTLNQVDGNSTPNELTQILREEADKRDLSPRDYYGAFYQLVSGKSSGPNAANLVMALGPTNVIDMIEKI